MRTLLISDLHSQSECLIRLDGIIKLEKPDYLICCGDICQGNDTDYLNKFIALLNHAKDAFIITGNNDGAEICRAVNKSSYSSNLKLRNIGGFKIFGISDCETGKAFDTSLINNSILLTHQPPLKEQLQAHLKNSPKCHISGHIHSRFGLFRYPAVTHIQVPALSSIRHGLSMYGIFDIEKMTVEFKRSS